MFIAAEVCSCPADLGWADFVAQTDCPEDCPMKCPMKCPLSCHRPNVRKALDSWVVMAHGPKVRKALDSWIVMGRH